MLQEAWYLYDAVWLYARAAHAAILNHTSLADGRAVLEYTKGVTYKSEYKLNHMHNEFTDILYVCS